ncbi:phosphotransferase [Nonomuraea sp. NPDC049028]|uniref:phosphotransferase n=1 Tax=Nonomuraea sp. NPDC049028 TaxID=3364348 RepID=UPI00371E5CCF
MGRRRELPAVRRRLAKSRLEQAGGARRGRQGASDTADGGRSRAWVRPSSAQIPARHIHGDANEGNLLRRTDGRVILLDFEAFAFGPRE